MDPVFELSGHDLKRLFYDSPDAEACPDCGLIVDLNWTNHLFKIGACRLDFGYTYDMAVIVSERFASLVRSWPGVRLDEITSSKGWFHLTSDQTVAFDPVRGLMGREEDRCDECGRFREVFASLLRDGAFKGLILRPAECEPTAETSSEVS